MTNYTLEDIDLADLGRKELDVAETEKPGLLAQPNIYIIIPVLNYSDQELNDYLCKHQFISELRNVKIFLKTKKPVTVNNKLVINYSQPDNSIYQAWNQCIKQLSLLQDGHEYYAIFCGIDDILSEKFFKEAYSCLNFEPDIIFGDIEVAIYSKIRRKFSNPNSTMLRRSKHKTWDIYHPGMFMHSRVFQNLRFDEKYKLAGDFKFFTEIGNSVNLRCHYIKTAQSKINLNGISNKTDARLTYLKELEAIEHECDVSVRGFNRLLEKIKLMVLTSRFGGTFRKIYWAIKYRNHY
jgi:hypothetical protein